MTDQKLKVWKFVGINMVGSRSYWIVDGPDYGVEKFNFVKKDDFDKLKKENAKLRAEVERVKTRLKNAIWHQERAKEFITHYDDCNALLDEIPEDESCQCGMDSFAHSNHISITMNDKALRGADETNT